MSDQTTAEFDEAWYLARYKDVADAVARGGWASGWAHYDAVGRSRGRQGAPDRSQEQKGVQQFDEKWYGAAYPQAVVDIRAGKAESLRDHYRRLGFSRGYLPFKSAPRPANPAASASRFGGLWTDQANALDLVQGRLDLGFISTQQAELLTRWIKDGYVILERAISDDILAPALEILDVCYDGKLDDIRFQVHNVGTNLKWIPETKTHPAKALDLHWRYEAIREVIFAPAIVEFLGMIFERKPMATQSLSFYRGSAQDGHQDSAYVNYSIPMQFAASWVALEDVKKDSGELFYYVGGHRMPETIYGEKFKGMEEAARAGKDRDALNREAREHIERIKTVSKAIDLKEERFLARKGDVLIWAADLPHGGSPISQSDTRKSIVTHYCPAELAPSYFELRSGQRVLPHRNLGFFSSAHYGTA